MLPILKEKSAYNREKQRRLGQALHLLKNAGIAVSLALISALLCITLLSICQNNSVPWLPLLSSLDELAFLAGSLLLPTLLLTLSNYHAWRFTLHGARLLVRHLGRSGQQPPSPDMLASILPTWQKTILQASVIAFLRQLHACLTRRPPTSTSEGKAPLELFQRASLLRPP